MVIVRSKPGLSNHSGNDWNYDLCSGDARFLVAAVDSPKSPAESANTADNLQRQHAGWFAIHIVKFTCLRLAADDHPDQCNRDVVRFHAARRWSRRFV